MKLSVALIATACVFALTASPAFARVYKIATNVSEDSTAGTLLADFAKLTEERTGGRVKFKIFPNAVLGDQLDYFQQIQKNVIDVGLVSSATLENVMPAMGAVNLPYVFPTSADYQAAMSSDEVRDALFAKAEENNFAPVGYLSSGYRSIYTTKPVQTAEDLKGLKLRTINSPTYMEMISLFGAVPTPMPFGEVYPALQQGVIDGAEGGVAGLYLAKFGEVAKYAVITNQTRLTDYVVMSLEFQAELAPEDLKAMQDAFAEIAAQSVARADATEAANLELAIKEMGVIAVNIDTAPLMKAVEPMYAAAAADPEKRAVLETIFKLQSRSL